MTALLGDPTWQAMKVADKIEAIKTYAHDIHAGSSDDLTSSEKRRIKTDAVMNAWPVLPSIAMLGLHSQISTAIPYLKARTLIGVGLGGVAVGLGVGAINAYIQAKQGQEQRQALRANLERVATSPTNINAIGVLSAGNIQAHHYSSKDALLTRARGELQKMFDPTEFVDNNFHKQINTALKYEQERQAYAAAQANHPH